MHAVRLVKSHPSSDRVAFDVGELPMISVIARPFTLLFALWLLAPSLESAQSDCGALISVPAGATCRDFYRQRESWDQDTIRRCGLTQVDAYQRALGIGPEKWADFLK